MDRNELKRTYKEQKTQAGVIQTRNTVNGKLLVESTPNLRSINGKLFGLRMGGHMNKLLEAELKEFGADAFVIEVLEVLEEPDNPFFDRRKALEQLREKWIERLQPFNDRGYHGGEKE